VSKPAVGQAQRRERCAELWREGLCGNQIALRLAISRSRVDSIIKKLKRNGLLDRGPRRDEQAELPVTGFPLNRYLG